VSAQKQIHQIERIALESKTFVSAESRSKGAFPVRLFCCRHFVVFPLAKHQNNAVILVVCWNKSIEIVQRNQWNRSTKSMDLFH
jgi:hypothetical protein